MEHKARANDGCQNFETYQYEALLKDEFRILELLPGKFDEPISIQLHKNHLENILEYEAISYAWGDPNIQISIICDGKVLTCTPNLRDALEHFIYAEKSRFLWADALW